MCRANAIRLMGLANRTKKLLLIPSFALHLRGKGCTCSSYYNHNHNHNQKQKVHIPLQRGFGSVSLSDSSKTVDCKYSFGGTCEYKGANKDHWITSLAIFAVSAINHQQDKDLKFVRVVGASHTKLSSLLYHVTLEATSSSSTSRNPKIYHAIVWLQLFRNIMELLVWRPVDDRFSVLAIKAGDLKLHEAVMFYMNKTQKDLPIL